MKRLLFLVLSVVSIGLYSSQVFAFETFPKATLCNGEAQASAVCNTDNKNPVSGTEKEGILLKVANFISYVTGIAAVIAIIIAGFEYVISSGDSAKIEKAKNAILYAVIGLVIVLSAQIIVRFVIGKL
jgi:hypothetical protein